MTLTISELMQRSNETAVQHGFWDDFTHMPTQDQKYFISTKLLLITSEVTEAMEALRKDGRAGEHFTEEIADIFIRTADLAQQLGLPLEKVLFKKMEKNEKRPRMHGKRF